MNQDDSIRAKRAEEAATWMWRLDRGLSAHEQDAFFDWLSSDPDNAACLSKYNRHWKRLDKLASWLPEHSEKPNPDLLAPSTRFRLRRFLPVVLAAAAALALMIYFWNSQSVLPQEPVATLQADSDENRNALQDGSVVKLKDDAQITVLFNQTERRVRLDRGEAFFLVAKDPDRPFIVEVQGVDISALGTAFNVRLDEGSFEVLVSEGLVKVEASVLDYDQTASSIERTNPVVEASQRAVISLSPEPETPAIATLTQGEIHRVLAWQHGLMTFTSKPLSEIAYELNHFNETQMVVLDEKLAKTRFSGSFRSDNMEGFVRLLEAAFGAQAEWNGADEVLLSKKVD